MSICLCLQKNQSSLETEPHMKNGLSWIKPGTTQIFSTDECHGSWNQGLAQSLSANMVTLEKAYMWTFSRNYRKQIEIFHMWPHFDLDRVSLWPWLWEENMHLCPYGLDLVKIVIKETSVIGRHSFPACINTISNVHYQTETDVLRWQYNE